MRIGELAAATGLSTSRIRFYESEGLIAPAVRLSNGYRDYPATTMASLQMIQQAQKFGFSLAEVRAAMRTEVPSGRRCDHFLKLLQSKLAEVDEHLAQMKKARARLVGQIAQLQNNGAVPL